jgi:hypothetical protein
MGKGINKKEKIVRDNTIIQIIQTKQPKGKNKHFLLAEVEETPSPQAFCFVVHQDGEREVMWFVFFKIQSSTKLFFPELYFGNVGLLGFFRL